MIPILARRGQNLLEDIIFERRAVAELDDEDLVTAGLLAYFQQLAAAGETGDLVRDDGLV